MPKRYPEAIKHYPESFQIVIKRIVNRVDGGKNALIIIPGQTGSGKSLTGIQIKIAIYLYMHGKKPTNEYIIKHIYFQAKKFMEGMKKVSDLLVKKKQIKTEVHLWDEAGAEAGHKEFMTTRNKILGWLIQTFRNLRQIVIFTLPSISFLDATIRKMLHYYLECIAIDKKNKMCIVKPLILQYNVRMDKLYYHNFTYPGSDGYLIEVDMMGVPKISDELEKMYEEVKNVFTGDLNEEILTKLTQIEHRRTKTGFEKLTDRQREIYELLREGTKNIKEIAKKVRCSERAVYQNFGFMQRKGVEIDKFLKETEV